MKKFLALLLAAMMAIACTAALAEEAGFEEFPIGDEQDVWLDYTDPETGDTLPMLHVAAVYFQPVPMYPEGDFLSVEEANFHVEADISWNANNLGFGAGDWANDCTVDYKIADEATGEIVVEGTFMKMNASDGPHYGANVALSKNGTDTLTFIIHSPMENGYLLHSDSETGVEGRFWEEPLEVVFPGWEYTVQEW